MELHLDRRLAERRFFPAMDIARSGTRREELMFDEATLKQIWLLRRMITLISNDGSADATERVLERLARFPSNKEFLANLNKEA
jgi:transcription termination factor Rho